MKRLLLILILTFSFQSLIKADGIEDFQIEGMSIGDSLLDYMTLQEITQLEKFDYSGKYKAIVLKNDSFNRYDDIQLSYKKNSKYIIHSLAGRIHFKKMKLSECLSLRKKIELDLSKVFINAVVERNEKFKHQYDKTGKSLTYGTWYKLEDGSTANIICYDWSKKIEKSVGDKLMIAISSSEFNSYLNNEAYQ